MKALLALAAMGEAATGLLLARSSGRTGQAAQRPLLIPEADNMFLI